jgi:hypothetical protein
MVTLKSKAMVVLFLVLSATSAFAGKIEKLTDTDWVDYWGASDEASPAELQNKRALVIDDKVSYMSIASSFPFRIDLRSPELRQQSLRKLEIDLYFNLESNVGERIARNLTDFVFAEMTSQSTDFHLKTEEQRIGFVYFPIGFNTLGTPPAPHSALKKVAMSSEVDGQRLLESFFRIFQSELKGSHPTIQHVTSWLMDPLSEVQQATTPVLANPIPESEKQPSGVIGQIYRFKDGSEEDNLTVQFCRAKLLDLFEKHPEYKNILKDASFRMGEVEKAILVKFDLVKNYEDALDPLVIKIAREMN